MKQTKPNKSEKVCCEYIKDGECTLNEREKADCCPKNGLYTKSQVDEMLAKECNNLYGELIRENIRLKAKLKEQEETIKWLKIVNNDKLWEDSKSKWG